MKKPSSDSFFAVMQNITIFIIELFKCQVDVFYLDYMDNENPPWIHCHNKHYFDHQEVQRVFLSDYVYMRIRFWIAHRNTYILNLPW